MLIRSIHAQRAAEATCDFLSAVLLSSAENCISQSLHCVGGQQYEADAAALDTRVNAHLVHILLEMCLFSPSACPGLLLNSMSHY